MSTERETTLASGIVKLTDTGTMLVGSWGKGCAQPVEVTINEDLSILPGNPGFNLVQMQLADDMIAVGALISTNTKMLNGAIADLRAQRKYLDEDDRWTVVGSTYMKFVNRYASKFGDPVGAVLSFVPPRPGGEERDVSSIYAYGLNGSSAKVYGKHHMHIGHQLVAIFWSNPEHSIGMAIPLPKRELLDQVIADLEAQLKAVTERLEKSLKGLDIV